MAMTEITAVAIAQTAFYAPTVPLLIWLYARAYRQHQTRRQTAWIGQLIFAIFRFIGGAVEIAQATDTRDQSLYVAVWVLLCVGTISILAALTDPVVILTRNYHDENRPMSSWRLSSGMVVVLNTVLIITAVCLGVGGGVMWRAGERNYALVIGFGIFIIMLGLILGIVVVFRMQTGSSIENADGGVVGKAHRRIVLAIPVAVGLLAIRGSHGMLSGLYSSQTSSQWNQFGARGNVVMFAFMVLFTEYLVLMLLMWISLGLHRSSGAGKIPMGIRV